MILLPEASSAYIDPFYDETTLVLTCDVIEPSDGKGYDRDPRSIAKRAEAYLKSSGVGDTAFFGPEPEFFIFDSVEWSVDVRRHSKILPKRPPGRPPTSSKVATPATARASRAVISRSPVDSLNDIRAAMCLALEAAGVPVERTTTKWQTPASAKSEPSSAP